jgi:hypothetical protein
MGEGEQTEGVGGKPLKNDCAIAFARPLMPIHPVTPSLSPPILYHACGLPAELRKEPEGTTSCAETIAR